MNPAVAPGGAPTVVSPTITSPAGGTNTLRPTDIATIGGSILRPIGGGLDVVLDCLQVSCRGTVNVLSRSPVAAAASARRVRSLGRATFTLKKGKARKVKVKLNALGRRLARKPSTKVKVVVDLGTSGTTTKNMTLTTARKTNAA